jgi:hypothetical protein
MPGPRWGARTSAVPGAYGISRQTFRELDAAIETMRGLPNQFDRGMNVLVHLLAMSHKGRAQALSRGTVSYRGQAGQPWQIPVRRITGEYYRGWNVKRLAQGVWVVYNTARETPFIEFGINPRTGGGVPRPIMKMSGLDVLRFIARTRVAERFSHEILGPLRDKRGRYRSFDARSRSFQLKLAGRMPMAGPVGRLP